MSLSSLSKAKYYSLGAVALFVFGGLSGNFVLVAGGVILSALGILSMRKIEREIRRTKDVCRALAEAILRLVLRAFMRAVISGSSSGRSTK